MATKRVCDWCGTDMDKPIWLITVPVGWKGAAYRDFDTLSCLIEWAADEEDQAGD